MREGSGKERGEEHNRSLSILSAVLPVNLFQPFFIDVPAKPKLKSACTVL